MSVRLTGFMVSVAANQIHLHWKTSSELFNDRFEIEKSVDGVNFVSMAAIKGRGTSINNCYQSIDHYPIKGVNYYRMKQVDFDGTVTILDVKSMAFHSDENALAIFPNPTLNELHLHFSPGLYNKIEVIDMEGTYLQSLFVNAIDYQLQIDLGGYTAGAYLLRLSGKKQLTYKRILKV